MSFKSRTKFKSTDLSYTATVGFILAVIFQIHSCGSQGVLESSTKPALGQSISASVNESDTRRLPNYESPTAKGDDVAVTTVQDNSTQPNNSCTTLHSEPKSANFVLLYILICIYSFLAITVTCHHYFVTSMSRICEDFKLSEDIVGATFMAAGSSAPELATVIIAVFFTDNDIGISDVIGSAVFNMLFVISLCGLFTNVALHLNWWPLLRNCFFYTISIMLMLLAIYNESVSWFVSVLLILGYVLYCVALYYNEFLEAWANTLPLPFNKLQNEDVKDADANYIPLDDRKTSSVYVPTSVQNHVIQSNGKMISSIQQTYQSEKFNSETSSQPIKKPNLSEYAGIMEQLKFYFISPIYFVCKKTIPDWQNERFHDLYFLTFLVSLIWISIYSYIMVWMITIIGEILRIPNTVMGLTFVAAGVSVPDAVTSLKVVKQGYADMAVSNAIGSNIFDILICLGIPWFLQTAIVRPGTHVTVHSKGMVYSTLFLFSTVILLIASIHRNGWKLDKKIGTALMIGYVVFMTAAVFYELFGNSSLQGC